MAILGTIIKQPGERLDYVISYIDFLVGRTDTLSSSVSTVTPSGLTIVSTTISNQQVRVIFSGGIDASSYKITTVTTTSTGLILEDEVTILIQET